MKTNFEIQPEIEIVKNSISYRQEYIKISFPLEKHYSHKESMELISFLIQTRSFPKEVNVSIHEKIQTIYEVLRHYKTYEPPQYYYSICPNGKTEKHALVMIIHVTKNSFLSFFQEINDVLASI